MINAKDIKRSFRLGKLDLEVLKGISLNIKKGEFVAIMGPSGSGKSTLLHQLAVLDRPTSGKIWLDNTEVTALSDEEKTLFRLNNLGYIFQDYALVKELDAVQNVFLTAMARDDKDYRRRAAEILDRVGLKGRHHHMHSELSGGQQQRVSIARSLINDPKILFADEPCANLDSESSRQVLEVFSQLNKEKNHTIVMVTHEKWHTRYVDRVINLKDGLIV